MSDLVVHEPHHVPVIDTMNRLGIAVIRVGDVITLAFKDREFMKTVGTEMLNCDETKTRITISGLTAQAGHKITCDLITDSICQPQKTVMPTPTYEKPLKTPVPPKPPRPPKEEAEVLQPKKPQDELTLPELLLAAKSTLAEKGKASVVFKEAFEPYIKEGTKVYYTQKEIYEPKAIIICKIQGVIVAACKVVKAGLRGHYLVEHDGNGVYTKQVYGKITFKKNLKKGKKND